MATSIRVFVVLIIFLLVVVISEARVFPKFSSMSKKINSEVLLHDLIHKYHQKRSMLGLERLSPQGPDPRHH
ncbi:hypothetical protein Lalb_Chr01g0016671 [Lupinus albus]|uniref:Uncharacterized protein n=1 Tax=Lupinus albus TaxID=3870 RepID=A0A6A4R970_LUPAL|nr:hypothetical protein Lalb_Chr01g0016671 [Lupinus albus]